MPENKKEKPYANLLKAVPNEEAYNKLSEEDKKGFDRAMKKAGGPMKPAPTTFQMRSGNSPLFKTMGSSPVKQDKEYSYTVVDTDKSKIQEKTDKDKAKENFYKRIEKSQQDTTPSLKPLNPPNSPIEKDTIPKVAGESGPAHWLRDKVTKIATWNKIAKDKSKKENEKHRGKGWYGVVR